VKYDIRHRQAIDYGGLLQSCNATMVYCIYKDNKAIESGVNTVSIPVSKLAPGSYVVKVQVNNNSHVSQVIKL
jgi:hypothetical protein